MKYVYCKSLLSALFLFSCSFSLHATECVYSNHEGFTVEGREQDSETYSCSYAQFPYYYGLAFRTQQGLRCSESLNSLTSMNLVCENRSNHDRSVKNVTMTCCNKPRGF
ncbi:hypothetical protein GW915_04505 [bacterium]|nr:hypothetical protein [bacterium]